MKLAADALPSSAVTSDGLLPGLTLRKPRGDVRAVALIAHGGRSRSTQPASRLHPTALRMYPFLRSLHAAGARSGLAVAQLRYRVVGYNEGDPVADIEWALDRLRERFGDVPACLLGHSMGGRASLRAAGHPAVSAVVALAPWIPADEPVGQVAGRTVVLVHGQRDRVTQPAGSLRFALAADGVAANVCRFEIARSGHAMLDRALLWHSLTKEAVLGSLGVAPLSPRLAAAFALPPGQAARIVL
jgi:pimeloyl-ACP methyl ester carboxylesterase